MGAFEMKSLAALIADRKLNDGGGVQRHIDYEVLRRCKPYVPFKEGVLSDSGFSHTDIGSGTVRYSTPYARRWYYQPAKFNEAPKRGNHWFERMKQHGGTEAILRGAAKIAGGFTK